MKMGVFGAVALKSMGFPAVNMVDGENQLTKVFLCPPYMYRGTNMQGGEQKWRNGGKKG